MERTPHRLIILCFCCRDDTYTAQIVPDHSSRLEYKRGGNVVQQRTVGRSVSAGIGSEWRRHGSRPETKWSAKEPPCQKCGDVPHPPSSTSHVHGARWRGLAGPARCQNVGCVLGMSALIDGVLSTRNSLVMSDPQYPDACVNTIIARRDLRLEPGAHHGSSLLHLECRGCWPLRG